MLSTVIRDVPSTMFAHVLGAKGVAVVTVTHRVQQLPARPARGSAGTGFVCATCGKRFRVTLHSSAATVRRRVTYLVLGLLFLALAAFLLWLTFAVGIQPDGPEDLDYDTDTASWMPYTGLSGFFAPVLGLTFLLLARKYDGVAKLRRVDADGTPSVLTEGHKLMS
ncbi:MULTISPECIES: hypothetical protein [unclassified Streptomyces]|uniref:hypothetical protein n=1 Tax=unclassified Streptomyces TaxID=2593676 RepID=UPI0038301E25